MAWYDITYSCGHTGREQFYGRKSARERRIAYLEQSGHCPDCFERVRTERREAANSDAQRWAAENNLPVLTGTEKQCAWAETIRREKLEEIAKAATPDALTLDLHRKQHGNECADLMAGLVGRPLDAGIYAVIGDCLEERGAEDAAHFYAAAWLFSQAEAKWWIDHRYHGGTELVQQRAEEPGRLAREEAARMRAAEQNEIDRKRLAEVEAEAAKQRQEKTRKEAEQKLRELDELRERQRTWLRRLSELIGHEPADLCLLRLKTGYGWRVLVNEGSDRYARSHLVDYYPQTGTIKTCRALVGKKSDLAKFGVDFWALNPETNACYMGSELFAESADAR